MSDRASGGEPAEVVVGREGRVLIPARLRRDLHLSAGSRLLGYVEDGRLVHRKLEQHGVAADLTISRLHTPWSRPTAVGRPSTSVCPS